MYIGGRGGHPIATDISMCVNLEPNILCVLNLNLVILNRIIILYNSISFILITLFSQKKYTTPADQRTFNRRSVDFLHILTVIFINFPFPKHFLGQRHLFTFSVI